MLQATDLLLAQGATTREIVDDSSFQGLRRERLGEQYAQKGLPATNLGRRRAKEHCRHRRYLAWVHDA